MAAQSVPQVSHLSQVTVVTSGADSTRDLGARLAHLLRAGDLVLLSGGLGVGKTTFVQGVGSAMGVRGRVSSPTFVIARTHRAAGEGPDLIHVDAYRLDSLEEVDALDLDTSLEDSVTVVEWGRGRTEALSDSRLEIEIRDSRGGSVGPGGAVDLQRAGHGRAGTCPVGSSHRDIRDIREITVRALGPRWERVSLEPLVAEVG